jgi:hypothetical protein
LEMALLVTVPATGNAISVCNSTRLRTAALCSATDIHPLWEQI